MFQFFPPLANTTILELFQPKAIPMPCCHVHTLDTSTQYFRCSVRVTPLFPKQMS